MKTILFSVALLISAVCFSQTTLSGNNGQYAENDLGIMEYIGHQSGSYIVKITNKQPCAVTRKAEWLSKDTLFTIAANASITVQLPGTAANTKIRSKPLNSCSSGDMGWIEIYSPTVLPITFKSITATKISDTHVKIEFDVAEVSGVNTYNIQVSTDGKTYKNIAIVFPDDTQPNRKYMVVVRVK